MDQTSNFSSDTSNSQAWTTNERVPEIYRAQELTHLGLGALGETGLPPISCVLFNSLASRQGRGRGGGVDLRLRRARTFSSISWDIWSAPVFPAHFVEQAACVPRPGRSRLNPASGRWVRFVAARWRRSPGSRAAPPPTPPTPCCHWCIEQARARGLERGFGFRRFSPAQGLRGGAAEREAWRWRRARRDTPGGSCWRPNSYFVPRPAQLRITLARSLTISPLTKTRVLDSLISACQ